MQLNLIAAGVLPRSGPSCIILFFSFIRLLFSCGLSTQNKHSWLGGGSLPLSKNHIPALGLSRFYLRPFGSRFTQLPPLCTQ